MNHEIQIQLEAAAVLNVPLQLLDSGFIFHVNGNEFRTSRVISDILSSNISQIHRSDATMNTYNIQTEHQGDFNRILSLSSFHPVSIPEDEISFVAEAFEILGTESIIISNLNHSVLTNEKVINQLRQHELFHRFYAQSIIEEIKYISIHFNELCETNQEELKRLTIDTLEKIISNENLRLNNETQLFKFINNLYQSSNNNCAYSRLYGYISFKDVSAESIIEFIQHFPKEDLTEEIWRSLSQRLIMPIENIFSDRQRKRYIPKKFEPNGDNNFNGIIKYLLSYYNDDFNKRVYIIGNYYSTENALNVTHYDNLNDCYVSNNQQNGWICFDFKENRIIPKYYQIRSGTYGYPTDWKIECSDDALTWDCLCIESSSYCKGNNLSHVFAISNEVNEEYRYIRIYQTKGNYFVINSMEFYGMFYINN